MDAATHIEPQGGHGPPDRQHGGRCPHCDFLPPYCIDAGDIDRMVDVATEAIDVATREKP